MPKPPSEDDVLRRMLKTPPKPFTPKAKGKPSPSGPTKARESEKAFDKKLKD